MMIIAFPLPYHIQDSEGAMPAKTMLVQHQQASEGGPAPNQELKPQRQQDHVHASVNLSTYTTTVNANDAPTSVANEHLYQ